MTTSWGSSAPATVAITGLRTAIGRRVAETLGVDGVRVVGLDLSRPQFAGPDLEFRRVDLSEPTAGSTLAEILREENVEAVLHTAFRREPGNHPEADHELETIGTMHLLHACEASKVKRLVVASSTMLYGPKPDNPTYLDEKQPLRGHPAAHNVSNRVEAEALVAEFASRNPAVGVSVLRTCWTMGPHVRGWIARYFSRRRVPIALGYDPLLQFVHEDDALAVFLSALADDHRGIFNVVGSGVLPLTTLLRVAGKLPIPLPRVVLDRFAPGGSRHDAPEGFFDYLRYLWVAAGERMFEEFGEPHYTTREAWMAFVSEQRLRRYR